VCVCVCVCVATAGSRLVQIYGQGALTQAVKEGQMNSFMLDPLTLQAECCVGKKVMRAGGYGLGWVQSNDLPSLIPA